MRNVNGAREHLFIYLRIRSTCVCICLGIYFRVANGEIGRIFGACCSSLAS